MDASNAAWNKATEASDAAKAYHMRYDRKMSNVAIAKELGVSEGKVRDMLKNPEMLNAPDYNKISAKISSEQKRCLEWLKKAVN